MNIGVVFPQTEIGSDSGAVREFAQTAEEAGYDYLLAYDHVLGADKEHFPDLTGPYTYKDLFHEPFVLFGYLSALTKRILLVSGIIILPQRQTALVAKQAAEVDVLSGGRLRLGIGLGWNYVEYDVLNESFHNRGRRSEEQVELLRALWTQEVVNFEGKWHRVTHAGLNPLPVQRPIPIWMGGRDDRAMRRLGKMGDGWIGNVGLDRAKEVIESIKTYAAEAGRDPADIGIQCRIQARETSPEQWLEEAAKWEAIGATEISFNTLGAGLSSPQDHIDAISRFKEIWDKQ